MQKMQAALGAGKEFSLESLASLQRGGRELQSPLNAVFGDRLEELGSSLALPMRLYTEDATGFTPLEIETAALRDQLPEPKDRICIFVHGLGSSERTWAVRRKSAADARNKHKKKRKQTTSEPMESEAAENAGESEAPSRLTSYTELLGRDTGHACFYVRYNTGRHISRNGRDLAELLNQVQRAYPVKLREINLIGHSMGGLVLRSAGYYGSRAGHGWIKILKRNLLLGSPLLGAHQEQIGKLTTDILNALPLPATRITAKFLDLRSAGIQDLGYGYLRDEDWQGPAPSRWNIFARAKTDPAAKSGSPSEGPALKNRRNPVPLLKKSRYCLIIGSLSKDPESIIGSFLGDGVVNRQSAHGDAGKDPGENYERYDGHASAITREIRGLSHNNIPGDPRVYRQIRDWLRTN